jgi:hypothetical protein
MKNLLLTLTIFVTSCVSSTNPIPGVNYYDFKEKKLTKRFDAVGLVHNVAVDGKCTGTFVEKDVVLTAAHCVSVDFFTAIMSALTGKAPDIRFYAGDRVFHATQVIAGSEDDYPTDVAFIIIAEKDNMIRPIPLATEADLEAFAGDIDFVGYGYSKVIFAKPDSGRGTTLIDGGKKRVTHLHNEYSLIFGHSTELHVLPGDSGGPVIDSRTGKVFAVASRYFPADGKYIASYYGLAYNFANAYKKHRIDKI